jgi:hypothetical protein
VVCVRLVGSRPSVCALEYLIEELFQLGGGDVAIDLACGVLDPSIFPGGMNLLLQRSHSACQPVGDHADSNQPELLELADFFG